MPESIYMTASLYDLIKMTVQEPLPQFDGEHDFNPESLFIERAIKQQQAKSGSSPKARTSGEGVPKSRPSPVKVQSPLKRMNYKDLANPVATSARSIR